MPNIYFSLSLILSRKPGTAITSVGDKVEIFVGMYISRDKAQTDADRWASAVVSTIVRRVIEQDCWPENTRKFIDFADKE